ncbi:hypothetical protein LV92_02647 [Arenibacter echinorum]|uniref:Uncharacterized protein n=2 Tax=Arenibacter echinorum TaxID=440515 RepID=A0A327R645_9FLAO|nr:hypothetical protein LV92_02647 [Arenibacter echinorum]
MKIQITVEFYDENERQKIKDNYPSAYLKLEPITNQNITIDYEEFKTYSQFHQQNVDIPDFKSYNTIKRIVPSAYGKMELYYNYDSTNEKITSKYDNNNEQNDISESIGCAGALSVLSSVYGLTEADWKRINISNHKDFDFDSSVVQGLDKMIVIEAKGSIVPDNSLVKHNRVSNHKAKIKKKKEDVEFKKNYPNGADLFIGTITVADPQNHLKLLLVDPPTESNLNYNLRKKIKLLKRLNYYFDFLMAISDKSLLTISLLNRIKVIEILNDVDEVDNIILRNTNNDLIKIGDSFIDSHSHIKRNIIGNVIPISNNHLLFIGFPKKIFKMLSVQFQSEILNYKVNPETYKDTIVCSMSINKAIELSFFSDYYEQLNRKPIGNFKFNVINSKITQASSGLNYSIIESKNIIIL